MVFEAERLQRGEYKMKRYQVRCRPCLCAGKGYGEGLTCFALVWYAVSVRRSGSYVVSFRLFTFQRTRLTDS